LTKRASGFSGGKECPALAVDVKTSSPLGFFGAEIDFARRRVDALGDEDELVDQFFHARQHLYLEAKRLASGILTGFFGGLSGPPGSLSRHWCKRRTLWRFPRSAPDSGRRIPGRANRNIEFQLVIDQIGMGLAEINIHAAAAASWGRSGRNQSRRRARDVPTSRVRSTKMRLRKGGFPFRQCCGPLRQRTAGIGRPSGREIARQPADAGVGGGEARPVRLSMRL